MIELRWFIRNSKLDIGWGGQPVYEKERILQYRYLLEIDKSKPISNKINTSDLQWSEWKDVLDIHDENI